MCRGSEIVPIPDRDGRAGLGQYHYIAGPAAIGPVAQPFHAFLEVDQVGPRIPLQIMMYRNKLSAVEHFERFRLFVALGGPARKDKIDVSLALRNRDAALILRV